jgi:DNA-binding transcriptional MerR regulator
MLKKLLTFPLGKAVNFILERGSAFMIIKIGEIAARYEISNRTLRYWEEEGILSSIRMENGYRYYDDENILRIKQIMMLRRLRLPIQDIQKVFISNELSTAVSVMQRHLDETNHEAKKLEALGIVLESLIEHVKKQHNLSDVFSLLEQSGNNAILELKKALQITLSEGDSKMSANSSYSKIGEVRIINLSKMKFACYRAESANPENDCWEAANKLILENSLHEKYGFRHFGFNNPEPRDGNPIYGYEMWFVVPEDFVISEPFYKREFPGGLFAAIPTQMALIGERWQQLGDWVSNNEKYELDWNPAADRRCLEECIDYLQFTSNERGFDDKQLDLLLPIKIKV